MRRHSRGLAVLSAVLMLALIAGPATAADRGTASDASGDATSYDGRTLFEGLFFGIGPVADEFPELASAPAQPPQALVGAVDQVVSRMERLQPRFFDRFAATMTSGDRPAVERELERAQQLMARAVMIEFERRAPEGQVGADCIVFWVAGAITLAVAGNVAYAVNAVRAGNVAWTVNWVFAAASNNMDASIEREMWVDRIAGRLQA